MPDERRSHPHRDGSLKLHDICFLTEVTVKRIALAFFGIMFDLCDTCCHLLQSILLNISCVLAVVSGRAGGSSTGIVRSKYTVLLNKAKMFLELLSGKGLENTTSLYRFKYKVTFTIFC